MTEPVPGIAGVSRPGLNVFLATHSTTPKSHASGCMSKSLRRRRVIPKGPHFALRLVV
jgi:hypothetical protein